MHRCRDADESPVWKRLAAWLGLVAVAGLSYAAFSYGATIYCGGGACFGTNNNDTMYGTDYADNIYADDGGDTVYAAKIGDYVDGGPAGDFLKGEDGNDAIDGKGGGDWEVCNGTDYCGLEGGQDRTRSSPTAATTGSRAATDRTT